MVDPPPKSVSTTTVGTQSPLPLPEDLDKDQAKDGTRLDLWSALQAKNRAKSKDLTEAEKKILAGFTIADRANGWQSVYAPGQTDASMHISPDNSVRVSSTAPIGSDEHIDFLLKSMVVAKSMPGEDAVFIDASDEKSRLIMCKCAELSGLQVKNPPEQSLDQADPALAKAVEARWRLMNGQPQPTANRDLGSTGALVTTPSALDTAPAVGQHFVAAVTPPSVTGAPTSAPNVVPKHVLT